MLDSVMIDITHTRLLHSVNFFKGNAEAPAATHMVLLAISSVLRIAHR